MKKCKVCGELTNTVYNINLKATPICEECARCIFLQQATWYAKQEFKNLALPRVSWRSEQLKTFLSKLVEEFDNGEVSWNTRDDAENMIKSF